MKKVNLFRIVVLLASISWLQLLQVYPSVKYASMILLIQVSMSFLYEFLDDDDKDDDNTYKPYNFDN